MGGANGRGCGRCVGGLCGGGPWNHPLIESRVLPAATTSDTCMYVCMYVCIVGMYVMYVCMYVL